MRKALQQTIVASIGAVALAVGVTSSARADEVFHEASPRSFEMGDTFTYRGQAIAPEVAAEKGLSCNQERSGTSCFDSQREALAAATDSAGGRTTAKTASKRNRRLARAALVCSANDGRPLVLWEHTGEGGWNVNMFTRQWWANLGNPYFANASSYRMGGHSGHMAEAADGYGYWYPGATGICAHDDMTGYSPSWNDRISSRYRN